LSERRRRLRCPICDGADNDCDPSTPDGADETTLGTTAIRTTTPTRDDDAFICGA
jgi:hypothetical protein